MKKRFVSFLLSAVMLLGVAGPIQRGVALAAGMTAIPVSPDASPITEIYALSYDYLWKNAISGNQFTYYQIQRNVPIYAIQQANGYYSNYMKLRDIAHYLDFDVVWSEDEPNAMRLYTTRHYLDAWTEPGPATENKTATTSTMDIYVDDVKVTGVQPVMIEYNNYFKVRDIAKVMDFWCEFKSVSYDWGTVNQVWLDHGFRYADEAAIAGGAQREWAPKDGEDADKRFPSGAYAKNAQYTTSAWYTGKIGQTESQPVTYSVRDAWGNYDYTKLYFGKTDTTMNAMAQLLLDRAVIDQNHEGVAQFNDGNTMNRYYRYPLVEYKEDIDRDLFTSSYFGTGTTQLIPAMFTPKDCGSNFGANFVIRSLQSNAIGVLSIEYNPNHRINKARVAMQKYAAPILSKMNTYSCDAEKIMFLMSEVCKKMVYSKGGAATVNNAEKGIPSGTEVADYPTAATMEEAASIWGDNKVYAGVCADYTSAFENLCNAAGYYYIDDRTKADHIYNWVWVPDEGRWLSVDCSVEELTAPGTPSKSDNDVWSSYEYFAPQYGGEIGDSATLDFFWMMEQIKPGGWLSTDYKLNP